MEPSIIDMLHRLQTKHGFGCRHNVLIIEGLYVGMLCRFIPRYEFRGNHECFYDFKLNALFLRCNFSPSLILFADSEAVSGYEISIR